jgi:hypothetical protein
MAGMLRVTRLPAVVDRFRPWGVYLDGNRIGAVEDGLAVEAPVDRGGHTVQVGGPWWASPQQKFFLQDGEIVEYVCRPRPGVMSWLATGVASVVAREPFIVLASCGARCRAHRPPPRDQLVAVLWASDPMFRAGER